MLKTFNELIDLDLKDYIEKKPTFVYDRRQGKTVEAEKKLDYLNWANVLILLYKNGAEQVKYGNLHNDKGGLLFWDKDCVFVRVFVKIDEEQYELDYPLIDGNKNIDIEKMKQSDIHNATQRAFVKCVAINTGLGLKLWLKDEVEEIKTEDLAIHNIYKIQERIEQLITIKMDGGMSKSEIAKAVGVTDKQFEALFKYFESISKFEKGLANI